MKNSILLASLVAFAIIAFSLRSPRPANAADDPANDRFEYVTLRWAGRDNTHIIRPSGNVEFIGSQLMKLKRPDRSDDRSFYMNVAMNALAHEGYELVAMTPDDYVMRRRGAK